MLHEMNIEIRMLSCNHSHENRVFEILEKALKIVHYWSVEIFKKFSIFILLNSLVIKHTVNTHRSIRH